MIDGKMLTHMQISQQMSDSNSVIPKNLGRGFAAGTVKDSGISA